MFGIGKRKLVILAATRHTPALAALAARGDVQVCEALTTDGAYRLLGQVALAVVDYADLAEGALSRQGLRAQIAAAGIPSTTGQDFSARVEHWLGIGAAAIGRSDALPQKAIAFANVSGGVGKTTLSFDLACYCAASLRVTAMVVELHFGMSAFQAITGDTLPDFYEIVTQDAQPGRWRGVTIVPMRWDTAQLALADMDRVRARLGALKTGHVVTIFDANPAHPFWPIALELADEVLAVALASRPDTLFNAVSLLDDLKSRRPPTPARLVLNRQQGLMDRLATQGVDAALRLGDIRDADRLDGRLAEQVVKLVYPYYRKPRRWARRNGHLSKQDQSLLDKYGQLRAELSRVRAEQKQVDSQLAELGYNGA